MLGPLDRVIDFVLQPFIYAPLIYPGLATVLVVLLTIIWAERKIAAKVQLRYGPLYVSKAIGGALQLLADGARFFFQEPIIPSGVDKWVFLLAPATLLAFTILPFIFIPASPQFIGIRVSYSLPIVLSLNGLVPPMVLAISWAANNKFTLIGGVREAFMTVAYETSLFIAAFAAAAMYGSLDLVEIVEKQDIPGIVMNPLAAIAFFVAMVMATSRIPFDIVEGEQEIVSGPYTEYSGILYGIVMGAGYAELYALSLVFTDLFLGGWRPEIHWLYRIHPSLGGSLLFFKAYTVMLVAVFLRSVYGRYRLDQALEIGWSKLFPLSLASVALSIIIVALGA